MSPDPSCGPLAAPTSPETVEVHNTAPIQAQLTGSEPKEPHLGTLKGPKEPHLGILKGQKSSTWESLSKLGPLRSPETALSPVWCQLSPVWCHLSPVWCHMSPVWCHVSPAWCHQLMLVGPSGCTTSACLGALPEPLYLYKPTNSKRLTLKLITTIQMPHGLYKPTNSTILHCMDRLCLQY